MKKAVFLDRDGTIARDVHYCSRPEDFELLPTVSDAIHLLNEHDFKVVIITNQSGIARGYFNEVTLTLIHEKMKNELSKTGAHIDAIYYCPHHPDAQCDCRKPGIALFLQAARDLDIDFHYSFVIGDTDIDIQAGRYIGARTILVSTGPDGGNISTVNVDLVAQNLGKAVDWILSQTKIKNSIIVPAYNEEKGVEVVLKKIFSVIDDTYEVIVVDDGSQDHTAEVALQFPCRVIKHSINKGKGEALKSGIAASIAENIMWIDADDSYPVDILPKIAEGFSDFDMVVCSRRSGRNNIPRFNRIGNWLFRVSIRRLYGFKGYDPCTGLYGVKKRFLQLMNLRASKFAIEPEISIKSGRMKLKTKDIPIEYHPRVGGSKLNAIRVGFEDSWVILKNIFWYPDGN
jgi:histidinol-phosphate phosphatase family protein